MHCGGIHLGVAVSLRLHAARCCLGGGK